MTNIDYDVTVVGAGPVGLVLAAELAHAGATVQVLERLAEPDLSMKAGAVNVPTAEALDRRGLLSAAEEVQREMLERTGGFARAGGQSAGAARAGRKPDTGVARAGGQPDFARAGGQLDTGVARGGGQPGSARAGGQLDTGVARGGGQPGSARAGDKPDTDVARAGRQAGFAHAGGQPDTRFTGHFAGMVLDADLVDWSDPDFATHTAAAGARMVPQRELEALLTGYVERLDIPIRRGVEVTGLQDLGDSVLVDTTAGPVRTRWLVGCDGGRSTVRRLAGINFPGTDPELTGHLAVVDIADPEKLADTWAWSPRGAYRCGPQPGRITTVEFDGATADRSAPVTLEELQGSLRRVSGTDVTITALRGPATRWTDNARQAETYRSGRVLLAGDAAHVHSPFGGQGLNLGVGDAMNLGWKLGAVVAGWAPEGLLDTYDTERRPLGAWVLDWTRAQIGVMRGDPKSAALREVVADLLRTPDGATHTVKKISGVTQRVDLPGDHPLTGRYAPDLWLADGSRLADHGHSGGFLLLDRTPDSAFAALAAHWSGRVTTVTDDHAAPTGVLVRPDGVVAWATDSHDSTGLEAALRTWAGTPSPVPAGR